MERFFRMMVTVLIIVLSFLEVVFPSPLELKKALKKQCRN